MKPGIDSSMIDFDAANSFIPQGGANKTYDYSGLSATGWRYLRMKDETGNTTFPTATQSNTAAYTFKDFEYRATDYYRFDKNGYFAIGRTQFDTSYSLATITGGPNDLFRYPQADMPFPKERQYKRFPINKESVYEGVDVQHAKFELTVAGFGLNQAPGSSKRWRYQKREVIGWGQIIIPDGEGGKTDPIDVLTISVTDSIIDSFYLGGKLAPAALLAAFGAEQGYRGHYKSYAFETIGLGRQVVGVITGYDDKIDYTYFRPQAGEIGVGVAEAQQVPKVSVYPTMVQKGGTVNIETEMNNLTINVALIGQDGKKTMLQQNGEGQFVVPVNLSSGVYVYMVADPSRHHITSGKLMVMD